MLPSLTTIFNTGDVFLFLNTSVGTGISSMDLQESLYTSHNFVPLVCLNVHYSIRKLRSY